MRSFGWLRALLSSRGAKGTEVTGILSLEEQIKTWHAANNTMSWGIKNEEFDNIMLPSPMTERDREQGFAGVVLCFGFGDNGSGYSDSALTGKRVWDYARRIRKRMIWQSPYINFDRSDSFRLRPGAPARPRGFYFALIHTGERYQSLTVSQARARFEDSTGCGPEGFQFLCITHRHFTDMMDRREVPVMVLADYDVAPYGFNDFFDAPHLFSSKGILGLGIGNVDRIYQGFGIPVVKI